MVMSIKAIRIGVKTRLQNVASGRLESSSYAMSGGILSKQPDASSELAQLWMSDRYIFSRIVPFIFRFCP